MCTLYEHTKQTHETELTILKHNTKWQEGQSQNTMLKHNT